MTKDTCEALTILDDLKLDNERPVIQQKIYRIQQCLIKSDPLILPDLEDFIETPFIREN